ncbi:MAG: WecB/TagA/CpsF family glycosyltransferase [Acidobacteria bacterium]|nr:WecB/TagA/CpsF family glycosyltransferase [Acidobacteriota bacterium]
MSDTVALPEKITVISTGISATSLEEVAGLIVDPPPEGLTVAVSNVQSVMMTRSDKEYAAAHAQTSVATTDGVPLVWALRKLGRPEQTRVEGFEITSRAIELGLEKGRRHFFYGTTADTLELLETNLKQKYPSIQIAGTHSPPFGPLTEETVKDVIQRVRESNADILWLSMGLPKHDILMVRAHPELPGVSISAIGAVFDWFAGNVTKAPEWMQKTGLEWLYRLSKEPRRLWRRYIYNNPAYLVLLGVQVLKFRFKKTKADA